MLIMPRTQVLIGRKPLVALALQHRGFRSSARAANAVATAVAPKKSSPDGSSQMSFPCLDKSESRTESLRRSEQGPEPIYSNVLEGYSLFHSKEPLKLDFGSVLSNYSVAYETWGTLNSDKSNAILLHTGLSASSHAKSQPKNTKPGWWEKFIGPGLSIDTDKFFVICTNVLGGCYGSTGPSSKIPGTEERWATKFPIMTIQDMVSAQNALVKQGLGINRLYASIGASMGGMQSLAYGTQFPEEVHNIVSISGCARSHPASIAMRHVQRQALMADPHWKRGYYYDSIPPHAGMKLAREIATITYRSGPEWEQRFGRQRADPSKSPAFCPDYLIETYLDHAGEKFCLEYDPNSLLYVSKAMDMFDLSKSTRMEIKSTIFDACGSVPRTAFEEQNTAPKSVDPFQDLCDGMQPLANHNTLVVGVESDILFPAWQQREIASVLKAIGGEVKHNYVELTQDISLFGHDTFLLDVEHIGQPVKQFLEKDV